MMKTTASWTARSMSTTEGTGEGAAAKEGEKGATEIVVAAVPAVVEKERRPRKRVDLVKNVDYNPPPIQPILSSETKTLIYELNKKDAAENTEEVLASRFGISDLRVKAILMLQKRYHERVLEGTIGPAGLEMEKFVERSAGTVKSGFNSPFYQVSHRLLVTSVGRAAAEGFLFAFRLRAT